MSGRRSIALVAVGDSKSQKADLLLKYTTDQKLGENFQQCIFVNNIQNVVVDRIPYSVQFVNAEGNDVFKSLRLKDYETANCFLLCYSIANRASFENISTKWCVEIRRSARYVPIILVGTEMEARKKSLHYVSKEEGENLMYLIGAAGFVECSVEDNLGIDEVFITAIRSAQ